MDGGRLTERAIGPIDDPSTGGGCCCNWMPSCEPTPRDAGTSVWRTFLRALVDGMTLAGNTEVDVTRRRRQVDG